VHAFLLDEFVYWPGEQVEQIFSPVVVVSLNCPAKHSEQNKLPSRAVLPMPQTSHEVVRLETLDAVSLPHFLHASAPS
jgi:hypothetical protein